MAMDGSRSTRGRAWPPPVLPLDNDDLLSEILLRLPPLQSSLPRASLVCKRWRRLVADPGFLRRFRAHHRKPPLIGVFVSSIHRELFFRHTLDPLDLFPPERFSLPLDDGPGVPWHFEGCRHGRVLLIDQSWSFSVLRQILVWDPVTGDQHRVAVPPELYAWNELSVHGAVVCAAGDEGHEHYSCHSSPFKVVLVCADERFAQACVYSSETGVWSNIISTSMELPATMELPAIVVVGSLSVLSEDSLYWIIWSGHAILEFDLVRQRLTVIETPNDVPHDHRGLYLTTLAEGGGICLLVLSDLDFSGRIWEGKVNRDGTARWLPRESIEFGKLLSLISEEGIKSPTTRGFGGDDNVMFLETSTGVFMVHLKTMQFKKLPSDERTIVTDSHQKLSTFYHPFRSFYPAEFALIT